MDGERVLLVLLDREMKISLGVVVVAPEPLEEWRTSPQLIRCWIWMKNWHLR